MTPSQPQRKHADFTYLLRLHTGKGAAIEKSVITINFNKLLKIGD